jgi:uncharacterized Rossmann fold enzyme
MTLNVVCVRHGEKYSPDYVTKLHAMVARNITLGTEGRFICFTDQPDDLPPHIIRSPLPDGVAGWWSKLALFDADLFAPGDRILYFDLDTVIVGDLDQVIRYDGDFAILRDFYRPDGMQSAVMAWTPSPSTAAFWDAWKAAGRPEIAGGDQAWIEKVCAANAFTPDLWQDLYPGLFCSYKVHCNPFPPEGASVVVFHGEPRPHDCGRAWVQAMWSEGDTGHFQLAMVANATLAQIRAQSRLSAERSLPRLTTKPAHAGKVAIVGGGPSLGDAITLAELARHHAEGTAIWALNGTHDWLIARGIVPQAMVVLDARAENKRFVANACAGVTYYLASQCHPDVYEATKDHRCVRFDLDIMGDCGTTVGTHAILIAHVEGYREIHLYGFDSSYRGEAGHAYAQDLNAADRIVDAHLGDKVFRAAPWMVRQTQDFETIARDVAAAGGSIIVHGDGLLPEMARVLANPEPTAADARAGEILSRLEGVAKPRRRRDRRLCRGPFGAAARAARSLAGHGRFLGGVRLGLRGRQRRLACQAVPGPAGWLPDPRAAPGGVCRGSGAHHRRALHRGRSGHRGRRARLRLHRRRPQLRGLRARHRGMVAQGEGRRVHRRPRLRERRLPKIRRHARRQRVRRAVRQGARAGRELHLVSEEGVATMATRTELAAAGMPTNLAKRIGTEDNASLTPTGSDQAGAAALASAVTTLATASAAGVRLPQASGASPHFIINNSGANQSLYPATGETINAISANGAFTITSAKTAMAVPANGKWVVLLSA